MMKTGPMTERGPASVAGSGQESGYAMVARIRRRELFTRLALAVFIAATTLFITRTAWPLWWLLAVAVSQAVDWGVFLRLRRTPRMAVGPAYALVCCLSSALSVAVYSSVAAYLWFDGGEFGRLFAMVQVAGGLLHVSLHMHHVRALLFSAAAPHAVYFLGLPVLQAVLERSFSPLLIGVAAVLYLGHLFAAVRQSDLTARDLRAARVEADRERQRAQTAFETRASLMAVISHEIRTAMNAVISAAGLLRRTRLNREQSEHVDMLMDAGDVLVGLLNDVLDFSRIEAGRMQLAPSEVRLDDRLNALRRLWEPRALARGVRLRLEIEDSTPRSIVADPLRFQQILFNLVSNAVKFTDQGEILIHAAMAGPDRLAVAVRDTGRGVPADRLERIFDSFEQAGDDTAQTNGGAGLGLAISRRLAGLMGGELTVSSVEGRGSTFTLFVPAIADAAVVVAQAAPETSSVDLAGLRILAADDNAANRRILALLLEPMGCRLTLVEHGEAAVAAAAAEAFDVILLDMRMPVMDGLSALGRIREGGASERTPVVALTAADDEADRAAWAALGAMAFLTKPIDVERLAQTLAQARLLAAAARAA